jgi:endonuclease/exonuclease/phosphatase family metal-dependent hydrolase
MSNSYAHLRGLNRIDPKAAERCASRLIRMRQSLRSLRERRRDGSLLLATWNIRDFDSNKYGFGPRLPESFAYIAEIVSCFDLVAMQEVSEDLSGLERVMRILGPGWDYIATDITEGTSGNGERMAFVFDTRRVRFQRLAGEVVLPEGQLVVSPRTQRAGDALNPSAITDAVSQGLEEVRQQFARTPFVVAFQSGWFKFNLCTVHIYFGDDSGAQLERRIDEIRKLVDFFAKRQDRENRVVGRDPANMQNYILLGDFNVVSPQHETMTALKRRGFTVPPEIDGDKVRGPEDHFYDQIAVRVKDERFRVRTGGLVDMFADVFRSTPEDREIYQETIDRTPNRRTWTPEARYLNWRTWQLSDHRPLWIEIETDYADRYLEQFAPGV